MLERASRFCDGSITKGVIAASQTVSVMGCGSAGLKLTRRVRGNDEKDT